MSSIVVEISSTETALRGWRQWHDISETSYYYRGLRIGMGTEYWAVWYMMKLLAVEIIYTV